MEGLIGKKIGMTQVYDAEGKRTTVTVIEVGPCPVVQVKTAEKDGYVGTDDASLAEKYGFEVRLVDCGRDNIKITYPEDIIFAEAILKRREEQAND